MPNALVITTSRKNAKVLCPAIQAEPLPLRIPPKINSLIVGDSVELEVSGTDLKITKVAERKNCLLRSYRDISKEIAANLDMLFVIAAPGPAGIIPFIDRVITTCELRDIPHAVILNKIDLEHAELTSAMNVYKQLGMSVLSTSTKQVDGLKELITALQNPELHIVALAGVSGVGKSTILNTLIPQAARRTSQVNLKSGLGKQTTTQAAGYLYKRPNAQDVLIIDLPGIQSFGVSHLSAKELADGFPEIRAHRETCEYLDCFHKAEPNCGVKDALARGEIAQSRYDSYLAMLQEIEANKPY